MEHTLDKKERELEQLYAVYWKIQYQLEQGNTSVSDKTTPIGKSGGASTGPRLGRMQDDAHASFKRTDKQVAGKMPSKFKLPSAKYGAKSSSMT